MSKKPTYEELEQRAKELEREAVKRKIAEERLEHLSFVLQAVRNVKQLITEEKDKDLVLQGVCNNLTKARGYYNAWGILLDESGNLVTTAEAGIGKDFLPLLERLKRGEFPKCVRNALPQSKVIVIGNPPLACVDCPLSSMYVGRGAMTVRLECEGKVYGLLSASIPADVCSHKGEQSLFKEVAEDIAFALYNIELEEKRRRMDEVLKRQTHMLGERVKELNCLYSISHLVEKPGITLAEILQGTVNLIPSTWQHPEIAGAKITLKEKEFKTKNYKETQWKLNSDILVRSIKKGVLTVCYLEERPVSDEGPFLKGERNLIDAITGRMGKIIEREWAETALKESEKRFRDLVENSLTGISIVQDNQVVYQNQEQERFLGALPRYSILGDFEKVHPDDVEKVKQMTQGINSGTSKTLDLEFRYFPSGKIDNTVDMLWIHCHASIIEYGGKESILVNLMDTTRSKELENLMRIQDKMASLGRVATGIAHEIRNPLSGINIYINTLEKLYDKEASPEKVRGIFRHIQSASIKIESVIRRVMDFSKPSEPKFVLTDINQPIEDATKLTTVTLRKSGIKIEKALGQDLPKCYADKQLLEEVILNLINNAADAMKNVTGEKKVMVSTSMKNNYVIIRVLDSGPGIPGHLWNEIFEPFYTTKSESTGIGLSLCHRIVMDHGGSMRVHSSKWGGAEFIIEIPVTGVNNGP